MSMLLIKVEEDSLEYATKFKKGFINRLPQKIVFTFGAVQKKSILYSSLFFKAIKTV
jgi:hypothetical protein